MNHLTDQQLLCEYARHRAEAAFAELVRRHVDLVFSAALRMVCDTHLAGDVTQCVFVALARNASSLADRPVLSGWLHRTTRNIAAQTVRAEVRRRSRETEAAAMHESNSTDPAGWERIAPQLDEFLNELSEPDRDALLLRYFERKSAREMAQTLGISDEASQKRVSRAIERLRARFVRRGITIGAGGLVVLISANAVQAAPAGLTAVLATAATTTGTSFAATATLKSIAMTILQKAVVTAAITAAVGSGIYEAHQATALQNQVQALRQQSAPLADQLRQLQAENDAASRQISALREENQRLQRNATELLRLRGEVTTLRLRSDVPPAVATLAQVPAGSFPNQDSSAIDLGRELGMAVVRGDPAAMQKVRDLSLAEHASFNTNSAGLDDTQRAELSQRTFAPLQAAYAVIADAAAKGNPTAMEAVVQSLPIPELQGDAVQSLGTMAGNGNEDALEALLNYQKYGLLLSTAVGALKPAADNGNQQAIAFLAAIAQDSSQQTLWYLAADGLTKAAAGGNSQAVDALIALAGDNNSSVKTAALSGLQQAAANQNVRATEALHSLGL